MNTIDFFNDTINFEQFEQICQNTLYNDLFITLKTKVIPILKKYIKNIDIVPNICQEGNLYFNDFVTSYIDDKYNDDTYYDKSYLIFVIYIKNNVLDITQNIRVLYDNLNSNFNHIKNIFNKHLLNQWSFYKHKAELLVYYDKINFDPIITKKHLYPILTISINLDKNYKDVDDIIYNYVFDKIQLLNYTNIIASYKKIISIKLYNCVINDFYTNTILNSLYDYLHQKFSDKYIVTSFKISYNMTEFGKSKIFIKN